MSKDVLFKLRSTWHFAGVDAYSVAVWDQKYFAPEKERCSGRTATSFPQKQVWPCVHNPKGQSFYSAPRGRSAAMCIVESVSGHKVRCLANVSGTWLPIDMPTTVFDQSTVRRGLRFLWWMSDDGSVLPQDIDLDVPPKVELSSQEQAERRSLMADLRERLAAGEKWEHFSGDGQ